jgi:hypothetical protein
MRFRVYLLAFLGPLSVAAHADTVYTSQAAFLAANPGVTTVNFDGIAPPTGFVNEGYNFSLGGATFASSDYINLNDSSYYTPPYNDGGYLLSTSTTPEVLTITFAPSSAVGLSLGGLFGPASVQVTLSDGTTTGFSPTDSVTGTGSLDFLGFTTATSISSIELDFASGANYSAFDNVSFGTTPVAVTPEPSSLLLLATGLVAAGAGMRRRLRP